jgi:hypothetical protein
MALRPEMPDYYREDVRRLWDQGWKIGKKLLAEIRKLGYVGSLLRVTVDGGAVARGEAFCRDG